MAELKFKVSKSAHKAWINAAHDTGFIKGRLDSEPNNRVVVSLDGTQYFGIDRCCWAYVRDLPDGTHYFDPNVESNTPAPESRKELFYFAFKVEPGMKVWFANHRSSIQLLEVLEVDSESVCCRDIGFVDNGTFYNACDDEVINVFPVHLHETYGDAEMYAKFGNREFTKDRDNYKAETGLSHAPWHSNGVRIF